MTTPQKRAKQYGYSTEVAALKVLQKCFPFMRRTGSMAYKKAAADLVQEPRLGWMDESPVRLVVTRDKRCPLLVTLSADDFVRLVKSSAQSLPAVVQVKGRAQTWIGRIYSDLKQATS